MPLIARSGMLRQIMQHDQYSYFRRRDYLKITVFGFTLTALYQSLHSIILPLRLLDFVGDAQKNTYLGVLTLSGLILGMFAQPIAGALSDRTESRWGRRRPFVFVGGLLATALIPGIGLAGGYAGLFAIYCLLQVSTNIAQGPYQGLIPDLVPPDRHGSASGVKGLLEITGGIALVYLSSRWMDQYYAGDGSRLWLVLGTLAAVMFITVAITMLTVREPRLVSSRRDTSLFSTLIATFSKDIRQNRSFLWFLGSRLLIYMAFTTIQQFALYYFQDVIGVTNPGQATFTFSVIAVIGMVIVVWPAGYLSDRIGRKALNIFAALLGAAGMIIIMSSQEYNTILYAAVVIGIGMGIFNSTNWALATDFSPPEEGARYLGVVNVATAGGAVLARAIGPLIDLLNNQSIHGGYTFMLWACTVYFIAGGLMILRIRSKPYDSMERY